MLKPNAINSDANRLQLELDAEEYPYFQEVERLSRSISFLAHECYVNYEFFHRMTPSPPYAKCGVKVTGYRQRCLFFGLYFKQLRRAISQFIAQQIPVTELQNMKEFRHFLPISAEVYAWCIENFRKIREASVTVEIRPPGPTSSAVVRLSGPPARCQELWERHMRAVPSFANQLERAPRDPVIAVTDARTYERKALNKPIKGREVDEHGVPLDGEALEEPEPPEENAQETDKPLADGVGEVDAVPRTPSVAGRSTHRGDNPGTLGDEPKSDLSAVDKPESERPFAAHSSSDRRRSEYRRDRRHSDYRRDDKRYEPYADGRRDDKRYEPYADGRRDDKRYEPYADGRRDDHRRYGDQKYNNADDRPRYNGHGADTQSVNDTRPYDKSHDRYGYNDRRPYGHHRAHGDDRYDSGNHYNKDDRHHNDRQRGSKRPYHDDSYNDYRHKDGKRDRDRRADVGRDGGRGDKHYRYDERDHHRCDDRSDRRNSSRYDDRWTTHEKEHGENTKAHPGIGFSTADAFQIPLPPPPPPPPPPPVLPVLPFAPPLGGDPDVLLPLLPPAPPVPPALLDPIAQVPSSTATSMHGVPHPALAGAAPNGGPSDAADGAAPEGRMLLGLIKADPTLLTKNPQFAQDFYKNYPALVPELVGVLAQQAATAKGGET